MSLKFNVVVTLVIIIALTGCVNSETPIPKRLSLQFEVENMNRPLMGQSDTLEITEFKFLVGNFRAITPIDDSLDIRQQGLIFSFDNSQSGGPATIIEGPIGFSDFTEFKSVEIFIRQAQNSDQVSDPDLIQGVDDSDLFTMAIKGQYNGEDFTMLSTFEHFEEFAFDEVVELSNDQETIVVTVKTDIQDVFFTNTSPVRLLDPREAEDKEIAVENFIESIEVEGSKTSQIEPLR